MDHPTRRGVQCHAMARSSPWRWQVAGALCWRRRHGELALHGSRLAAGCYFPSLLLSLSTTTKTSSTSTYRRFASVDSSRKKERFVIKVIVMNILNLFLQLDEVSDDFLVMRKDLEEKVCVMKHSSIAFWYYNVLQGLFKFDPLFYTAVILHIALLELVSLFVLWCYGNGWSAWILAGLIGCVSSVLTRC